MDEQILQQIFDELFESLEPLDTQTAALLQFLKSKGIVTDQELAPFLKQAGDAASVRWLGARIRAEALISSALRSPDDVAQQPEQSTAQGTVNRSSDAADATVDTTDKEKAEAGNQAQTQTEKPRKEAGDENITQAETEQDDSDLNSDLSDPPLFPTRKKKDKESEAA